MLTVLLILIILNGMTRYAFRQITQMKLQTGDSIFSNLEKAGVFSRERFNNLVKKEVYITSKDGLRLCGYVLESHPESNRWAIIVHGYTVSLHVSTQYIDMFECKGFNVLLIDQRRHGNSQGKYTTYGFMEKHDVDGWVQWIIEHYGENSVIGLHGQSVGGGTVIEYLSIAHPNVKFVVAECPYSDLTELLRHQIKVLNKLPIYPLLPLVNIQMQKRAGFRMQQVSPLRAVRYSSMPLLLIHGTEDNFVPTQMSKSLYEHKRGPKRLLLIEGAVHGNAYAVDPQSYTKEVHALIQETLGPQEEPMEAPAPSGPEQAYLPSI
ncbi:2-succinyl-6-hydroxy-2,4-cyclohexadiene-1-carboxylate synthase [compost metagenome]